MRPRAYVCACALSYLFRACILLACILSKLNFIFFPAQVANFLVSFHVVSQSSLVYSAQHNLLSANFRRWNCLLCFFPNITTMHMFLEKKADANPCSFCPYQNFLPCSYFAHHNWPLKTALQQFSIRLADVLVIQLIGIMTQR